MQRCLTHPTHDSIFGDTYHGVPNPLIPHYHPWPTRFHGPNFNYVQGSLPWRSRPWKSFSLGADERAPTPAPAPSTISPKVVAALTLTALVGATVLLTGKRR